MKNKIVLAVCVAVMLVPAILAIFLYKRKPQEIIKQPDEVSLVTVTDSLSNTYTVNDKDEIKFLTDLANGSPVAAIPDAVYGFQSFVLRFTRGENTASYRFYMSAEMPDQVYFKDEEDRCFKADSLKSRTFMEKAYAISLYDTAVPVLTVGDMSTVVTPSQITWNYSTLDGKYTPIAVPTTTDVKSVDKISKRTLGISFSRQPSNAVITVFDGEEQIVSRLLEDFTGVNTATAKYFKIQISATWNEEEGQNSYGTATYLFNAYVMPDASFSISAEGVQQGGVIMIKASNAKSAGITFASEPDMGVTPQFYDVGENAVAYLPTDYFTQPGEYKLTLSYDGSVFEQKLLVTEYKFNSKTYSTGETTLRTVFSAENKAAEETMQQAVWTSVSNSGLLCEGESPKYPTKRTDHKTGYGNYMKLEKINEEFRHDGVDYEIAKGSEVRAILSGTVVYVGSGGIHGGTIVIDHGNGVRSWYSRVDTTSVTVGQSVAQGDLIAKTNDSGFGDASRFHFGVSVGKTFVSPLMILEKGLPK